MYRPVFQTGATPHRMYDDSSRASMPPPTAQCCWNFWYRLVSAHCLFCLLHCLHLKCESMSMSMSTTSVCREACIAAPRNETSHESALGVTDAGRTHQQGITMAYKHGHDLLTSVETYRPEPDSQEHIKRWATLVQEACLKSFIKCCRSALFEAGVHECSVGGHIAVYMHGPEHPASCCQVPSA